MRKYQTIKKQLKAIKELAEKHQINDYMKELLLEVEMTLAEIEADEICDRLDKERLDVLESGEEYESAE